jgi:hypothetical protein
MSTIDRRGESPDDKKEENSPLQPATGLFEPGLSTGLCHTGVILC